MHGDRDERRYDRPEQDASRRCSPIAPKTAGPAMQHMTSNALPRPGAPSSSSSNRTASSSSNSRVSPTAMPNPRDAGSARVMAALGFRALASTSSGFAFTLGRLDGAVTLDEMAEHASTLDRATDLPVSVDLENG